MPSTSIASVAGSRLVRFALWTTGTGSSKSTATSYHCDFYPSLEISIYLWGFLVLFHNSTFQ